MTADYFDQIAAGKIDPPPRQLQLHSLRMDEKEGLAFLTVGGSETTLNADECRALALELMRIADEFDCEPKE